LAPAEEGVALDIALHFEFGIEGENVGGAEFVNLHGVVDDEFGGEERIDFFRVAAEGADGIAHGGEIHDGWNAGEILEEDAGGHEGDFFFGCAGGGGGVPGGEGADIVGMNELAVFVAEEIFEQDFEREGEPGDVADGRALDGCEAVDIEGVGANAEGGAGAEGIAVWRAHAGVSSYLCATLYSSALGGAKKKRVASGE